MVVLIGAAIFGQYGEGHSGYEPFLKDAMPAASSFTSLKTSGGAILYQARDASGNPVGYITAAEGPGYGGPMSVLVNWTLDGTITAVNVPRHHEDMPWWKVLFKDKFFNQYIGRSYSEPLLLDSDIDAATGSTVSSNGVAVGVRNGRLVLASYLGHPYSGPREPLKFGWPEILVVAGMALAVIARTLPVLKGRSWPRLLTLFYGFIILGVWLSIPLSLTNIASWLVGYAPHLQTFLVMYLMVFGVIGLTVIFGKNFYCFWLCPYSAVQESLHLITDKKTRPGPKLFKVLHNTRFVLLFIAVFLVLLLKNPSVSVFEPWNVLFSMKGTTDQWVLMIFALVSALFVYNFWCHYLCPVGAVLELILKMRKGVVGIWQRIRPQKNPGRSPTSS
ncbi:FMN-binding protein [Dehalogenimonas formicexedens]|uniref:FMN-binding protein n=1 Tax=Dehalogenimonas formicexedens TaxID=1839801 RepID=UPI0011AB3BF5|nr:4Fe-4S binding protein [Dehalogenimonas formicexedens]